MPTSCAHSSTATGDACTGRRTTLRDQARWLERQADALDAAAMMQVDLRWQLHYDPDRLRDLDRRAAAAAADLAGLTSD